MDSIDVEGKLYASLNKINICKDGQPEANSLPGNWQISKNLSHVAGLWIAPRWNTEGLLLDGDIYFKRMNDNEGEVDFERVNGATTKISRTVTYAFGKQYAASDCNAQILIEHKACPHGHALSDMCQQKGNFGHHCEPVISDLFHIWDGQIV